MLWEVERYDGDSRAEDQGEEGEGDKDAGEAEEFVGSRRGSARERVEVEQAGESGPSRPRTTTSGVLSDRRRRGREQGCRRRAVGHTPALLGIESTREIQSSKKTSLSDCGTVSISFECCDGRLL